MKNTDWIGNTISILMFAVLAIASWALAEMLQRGQLDAASQAAKGPNAIVEQPRIIRTDINGVPRYRVEASRMSYDEQADRSMMEQPVMTSLAKDKPKTVIQSDTAIGTDEQNKVELIGNVRITREPFADQPSARMTTARVTLLIDEERVMTDEPVLVKRGTSTLQGIGLRYDQKTQRIDIVSESRMVVPKENK